MKPSFTEEERNLLEESKWFLKTPDELKEAIQVADNVKTFVEFVNNGAIKSSKFFLV